VVVTVALTDEPESGVKIVRLFTPAILASNVAAEAHEAGSSDGGRNESYRFVRFRCTSQNCHCSNSFPQARPGGKSLDAGFRMNSDSKRHDVR
jgi:hypothetical protein